MKFKILFVLSIAFINHAFSFSQGYGDVTDLEFVPNNGFVLEENNKNIINPPVWIFSDKDFRGSREMVGQNIQYVGGFWNDQISSILVPEGVTIKVYIDAWYKADSMILTKNWNAADNPNWDQNISSIKILSSPGQHFFSLKFYNDAGFQGKKYEPVVDAKTLTGDWDNEVSSIQIPEGCFLEIFKCPDFSGESVILTGNWDGKSMLHSSWNNEISSFRIIYPTGFAFPK